MLYVPPRFSYGAKSPCMLQCNIQLPQGTRKRHRQTSNISGIMELDDLTTHRSGLQKLCMLTDILTAGDVADERLAGRVSEAWEYLCTYKLWSLTHESLEDYCRFIDYENNVRPIIQGLRRSDRTKIASLNTIAQNWALPVEKAIPSEIAPLSWSKHVLSLMAALSRHCTLSDSIRLLKSSIKARPVRSRHSPSLIASDIDRALNAVRKADPGVNNRNISVYCGLLQGQNGAGPEDSSIATGNATSNFSFLADLCNCPPICLPLKLLLGSKPHRDNLSNETLTRLVAWVEIVSWSSICDYHLSCLAGLKLGKPPMECSSYSRESMIAQLRQPVMDGMPSDPGNGDIQQVLRVSPLPIVDPLLFQSPSLAAEWNTSVTNASLATDTECLDETAFIDEVGVC